MFARLVAITALVLTLAAISRAPGARAQGMPPANTALRVIDANALSRIRTVAVVSGMSGTYDRKKKTTTVEVIAPTTKLVEQFVIALKERAGANVQVAGDGSGSVDLVDPFEIDQEKDKALGGLLKRVPITWTERAWDQCGNCDATIESQKADALWVVWGRWISDQPADRATKIRYTNEKGWLHGSAHLFDVNGKLIAITSMNRSGTGALGIVKTGPAYTAIGRAMVKSFLKHRGAANDTTTQE